MVRGGSLLGVAVLLGCVGPVCAHEYKGMSTQIVIDSTTASVTLNMAATDTMLLSPPIDRDKNARMSRDEFDLGRMMLESGVPLMMKFTTDGVPVLPQSTRAEVDATEGFTNDPHTIKFSIQYAAPEGSQFGRIRIDPNLFRSFVSSPVDGTNIVGTQRNTVTILDRGKQVTLQSTGHEVYDSGAGNPGAIGDAGVSTETAIAKSVAGEETSGSESAANGADVDTATASGGTSTAMLLWTTSSKASGTS